MSEDNTKTDRGEVQERIEGFVKEYGELVNKWGVDFANYPVQVPIPNVAGYFGTVVQTTPVDIKNQPKKSPFIAKE